MKLRQAWPMFAWGAIMTFCIIATIKMSVYKSKDIDPVHYKYPVKRQFDQKAFDEMKARNASKYVTETLRELEKKGGDDDRAK